MGPTAQISPGEELAGLAKRSRALELPLEASRVRAEQHRVSSQVSQF